MRNKRKGFYSNQTPEDFNIYHFTYYSYSPLMAIKIGIKKEDFVRKDHLIALVTLQDASNKQILAPFSGKVLQVNQPPQKSNDKPVNYTICTFEKCEHAPNPVPDQKGLEYCIHCGQTIWLYYEKSTINFTIKELEKKMQLPLFLKNTHSSFAWTVTKNQHITQNTEVATAQDQKLVLGITGKVRYLGDLDLLNPSINTQKNNPLDKVFISVSKVVCRHQKIIDKVCQFCLVRVSQAPPIYLFQQKEKLQSVSGRSLQLQQQQYFNKLIDNRRAIVILDIDNTFLHAVTQYSIRQELDINPELLNQFLALPTVLSLEPQVSYTTRILLKIRPYFEQFLKEVVKRYDVYLYTKGTRAYAKEVCMAIRQKYKEILQDTQFFKEDVLITRDQDPRLQAKSINYIVPNRVQPIIVLDDRRQIWESSFCLYVKEFMYFRNHPQDKTMFSIDINVKMDSYMLYAKNTLCNIHREYFKAIQKQKKKDENKSNEFVKNKYFLSKLLATYKRKLLSGMKVRFLLKDFCQQNIQQNVIFKRAKRLGIEKVKDNETPTVVVRSLVLDQSKVKQIKHYAQNLKLPIVSETWLVLCYQYTYNFSYESFIIQNPLQKLQNDYQKYRQLVLQTAKQFI